MGKSSPARFQITLAQTPQRSFQGAAAGTHATPAPNRAHSGLHGETGAFRTGVVSLPSERFARFGNPAWPGVRTAYFAVLRMGGCVGDKQRAFGTETHIMRVSVPRRRGLAGPRCSDAGFCAAPANCENCHRCDEERRKNLLIGLSCFHLWCEL